MAGCVGVGALVGDGVTIGIQHRYSSSPPGLSIQYPLTLPTRQSPLLEVQLPGREQSNSSGDNVGTSVSPV